MKDLRQLERRVQRLEGVQRKVDELPHMSWVEIEQRIVRLWRLGNPQIRSFFPDLFPDRSDQP